MEPHEKIRERELKENKLAQALALETGRSVTFIASDGCEVTVTPSGAVFYNASDWY